MEVTILMQRGVMNILRRDKKATVEQLATELYNGEYNKYTRQNVHAAIYSLRKKGFDIQSIKDPLDERMVVCYQLTEKDEPILLAEYTDATETHTSDGDKSNVQRMLGDDNTR